jgi:histidine ammonia-lyase
MGASRMNRKFIGKSEYILAIELLTACQAIEFSGPANSSILEHDFCS